MSTTRTEIAEALLDVVSVAQFPDAAFTYATERFGATAVAPLGVAEGADFTELLCGVTMLMSGCIALAASALNQDRDEVIFELRRIIGSTRDSSG